MPYRRFLLFFIEVRSLLVYFLFESAYVLRGLALDVFDPFRQYLVLRFAFLSLIILIHLDKTFDLQVGVYHLL